METDTILVPKGFTVQWWGQTLIFKHTNTLITTKHAELCEETLGSCERTEKPHLDGVGSQEGLSKKMTFKLSEI